MDRNTTRKDHKQLKCVAIPMNAADKLDGEKDTQ